jgi:hypothetical protein
MRHSALCVMQLRKSLGAIIALIAVGSYAWIFLWWAGALQQVYAAMPVVPAWVGDLAVKVWARVVMVRPLPRAGLRPEFKLERFYGVEAT